MHTHTHLHTYMYHCLSSAFAKLRKATNRFVMSACLSLRPRGTTRFQRDGSLLKFLFENFRQSSDKIFHWNLTRIKGTLHAHICTFKISRWIVLRMRNVSDKICRENRNTHFMINKFFRKSCSLWDSMKNMVEPNWPQMTIRHMRIACWIPRSKNSHIEYVILQLLSYASILSLSMRVRRSAC